MPEGPFQAETMPGVLAGISWRREEGTGRGQHRPGGVEHIVGRQDWDPDGGGPHEGGATWACRGRKQKRSAGIGDGGRSVLPGGHSRNQRQILPVGTKTWLETNSSSMLRERGVSSLGLLSFLLLG